MKKTYKMLSILVIAVIIMASLSTIVIGTVSPDDIKATTTSADKDIKSIGGKILSAVTTAGVVISVIMVAVLGIKYMMGSSEEKSEYKKSMIPYLVGAVCIFAASTIANAVYNLAKF